MLLQRGLLSDAGPVPLMRVCAVAHPRRNTRLVTCDLVLIWSLQAYGCRRKVSRGGCGHDASVSDSRDDRRISAELWWQRWKGWKGWEGWASQRTQEGPEEEEEAPAPESQVGAPASITCWRSLPRGCALCPPPRRSRALSRWGFARPRCPACYIRYVGFPLLCCCVFLHHD